MATVTLKTMAADPGVDGVKKKDLFRVDPRLLQEEPGFNARDYEQPEVQAHVRSFADSYKAGRFVPALVVRVDADGKVIVVEGHCRRRGAHLAISEGAELSYVDCVPFRGDELECIEVMLRSADGLPLDPLEVALRYLRLQAGGYDNRKIAERVNKTAAHVEQMLLLAKAGPEVHELVRSGAVAANTAVVAVRQYRERAAEYLKEKLAEVRAQGKASVSRGALKEWTPPRKVVTSVIGSVESIVSRLDRAARRQLAECERLDASQLKGRKVEVDAASLLALVQAHGAVADAREAKEVSQRAAKAAASQQSLEAQ